MLAFCPKTSDPFQVQPCQLYWEQVFTFHILKGHSSSLAFHMDSTFSSKEDLEEPSQFPPIFHHVSLGPLTGPLGYPLLAFLPHPTQHLWLVPRATTSFLIQTVSLLTSLQEEPAKAPKVCYTPSHPGSDGILMLLQETRLMLLHHSV